MKKLFIMIVLTFAFSATGQAGSKNLDLETWFELENRNQIQNLHLHMASINEKDLGGWDYTTVWDVHDKNYLFEGLRVMRLLTDSREIAWQGCCYTPAAGMVLEIGPETDLVAIEEKYDCDQFPDSIAINGLHFFGHANEGKGYVELRCSTF